MCVCRIPQIVFRGQLQKHICIYIHACICVVEIFTQAHYIRVITNEFLEIIID